jgi:arylsulfatase A-like enzyme
MFTLRYGNTPDWYEGERLVDPQGYATDVVTDEAIRYLRQQRRGAPFFLYVAFAAPHYGKGWDEINRVPTNVLQAKPETIARMAEIKSRDRRIYAAMVVEMDEAIGRILATLDTQGLVGDTWVIFASDNGADWDYGGNNGPLNGEKGTLWEGGIRVPCILRWPGRIEPGTVIDQPAMALDLLPTLCRVAGVSTEDMPIDGVDLSAAWFDGGTVARDVFHLRGEDASFRRGNWKYLRTGGEVHLFNLSEDLGEKTNLASRHPEKLAQLAAACASTVARIHARPDAID